MGSTAGFRRRPRRGSLQFWHRKKANRMVPRVRSWKILNENKLSGFAGYKAGMTQISFIDNRESSPTKGEEIMMPVTVIETPQIIPFSLRLYSKNSIWIKSKIRIICRQFRFIIIKKTNFT